MTGPMFVRPDFVVVGATYGNHVQLLASRELNDVELREEMDHLEMYQFRGPVKEVKTITLVSDMDDYLWVQAPTYPEAWAALFAQWSPPSPAKALPNRKAIQ